MTRINVIPVNHLCDKHLLAEFRELLRIPNAVKSLNFSCANTPEDYVLGEGHVKFFYRRLGYLEYRYKALYNECLFRGFAVTYYANLFDDLKSSKFLFGDYVPTTQAININRERIIDRFPSNGKFTNRPIPSWVITNMRKSISEYLNK